MPRRSSLRSGVLQRKRVKTCKSCGEEFAIFTAGSPRTHCRACRPPKRVSRNLDYYEELAHKTDSLGAQLLYDLDDCAKIETELIRRIQAGETIEVGIGWENPFKDDFHPPTGKVTDETPWWEREEELS